MNLLCGFFINIINGCLASQPPLYNGLYGKTPSEKGTFFSLRVYEKVGILLSEVYEGVRKSVVLACERAQRANR